MRHTPLLALLLCVFLGACERDNTTSPPRSAVATPAPVVAISKPTLSMKIDGAEWRFEAEVFGAFHPPGYERAPQREQGVFDYAE